MGEDGEVMKLKKKYAKREEIPVGYEDLYSEVNGEFVFDGVDGLPTEADVTRLNEALRKERTDHKAVSDAHKAITSALQSAGIEADALGSVLDEYGVLKANGGKGNEDISKLHIELAQLRREKTGLEKDRDTLATENQNFKQANTQRTINDALVKAAQSSGIKDPGVLEDLTLYAGNFTVDEASGAVVTNEGLMQPEVWLSSMKDKRPHWWPASQGGGAHGGNGPGNMGANPWTAANWNMTQQSEIARQNPERAKQMAQQAGTTLGGAKPVSK